MLKENYYIKAISHKKAIDIVVAYHYLQREAPCSFAFGLFEQKTDILKGVVIYGTPSSPTLREGICGEEEKFNVIELTRLWISDDVPKNGESFLVGNTLKLLDKEIVVSFAEIQQGHVGAIYQATNWIYTGLSAKRGSWTVEGMDKHCQTIADQYSAKTLRRLYGDRFKTIDRPRKHRYIHFNCAKLKKRERIIREKELLKKLKYPILPYPKLTDEERQLAKAKRQMHVIGTSQSKTESVDYWLSDEEEIQEEEIQEDVTDLDSWL